MHRHVLKCCKATLDMSPIIMGTPSDVDGGLNKLFWVLFFFYIDTKWFLSLLWKTNIGVKTYLWINLLPITDVNNGDIPGTRTVAHLLLQFFFFTKTKEIDYYICHTLNDSNITVIVISLKMFDNIMQYIYTM